MLFIKFKLQSQTQLYLILRGPSHLNIVQAYAPTKESRDPALALADGMKFLLRFGDDRSALSAPAALAADG